MLKYNVTIYTVIMCEMLVHIKTEIVSSITSIDRRHRRRFDLNRNRIKYGLLILHVLVCCWRFELRATFYSMG